MISVHKLQERLAACSPKYSSRSWDRIEKSAMEALRDQQSYAKRASELLDTAVKFDLGEISFDDSRILFDTARECVEEGVFSLPYEVTYIEVTLEDNASNHRIGSVISPASKCFDESYIERHPEFIDRTVALNFVRKNEDGTAGGSWVVPTVIAVFSRDFTKSYSAPAAKELVNYAALTEDVRRGLGCFNTALLYVIHSVLNARGVEFQIEPAPANLNQKRIRKNQPPLYGHRILKIGGYSSSGRVRGVGASHASPSAHWQRGHIHTIHRGTPKQKRLVVPATLISGPGVVSKDYEISR